MEYYSEGEVPVFICLLCLREELKNSEIAILNYEEYLNVSDNKSITIGLENNKHNFLLFSNISKSREDAFKIPTTRITKKFDDLAREIVCGTGRRSPKKTRNTVKIDIMELALETVDSYPSSIQCPLCKGELEVLHIINDEMRLEGRKCCDCGNIFLKKQYYREICSYMKCERLRKDTAIMEYEVSLKAEKVETSKTLKKPISLNEIHVIKDETDICPIHKEKMIIKVLDFGKGYKDTVNYCTKCGKNIISQMHKEKLEKILKSRKNLLNAIFINLE